MCTYILCTHVKKKGIHVIIKFCGQIGFTFNFKVCALVNVVYSITKKKFYVCKQLYSKSSGHNRVL